MRTLAPGRRQKAAKVKPDSRMKDALLIKLVSCSCREGMLGGGEGKGGEGRWEIERQHTRRGGHRRTG